MSKQRLKPWVRLLLICIVAWLLLGAVSRFYEEQSCQRIVVRILNMDPAGSFLEEEDILDELTQQGARFIKGEQYRNLSLSQLESQLKRNPFVEECHIYRDLSGTLFVEVQPVEIIARFHNQTKTDFYWSKNAKIIPFSAKFTPRTLVLTRDDEASEPDVTLNETDARMFQLVHYIYEHPFWKACISQLHLDKKQHLWLYPQIGQQAIQVGMLPETPEHLFDKLEILYKHILPQQGWYRYKKVDLRFEQQIICE